MKIRLFTLPNIITLMNLLCGSIAITSLLTLEAPYALKTAFILMLFSAVFDFLDGFVARLTGQYSKIGVQLDSLADVVSFGLLPSLIAMKIFYFVGGEGWAGSITLIIVAFSALRLAKFNIDETQHSEFRGLPTPANALLIGSAGWWLTEYITRYNNLTDIKLKEVVTSTLTSGNQSDIFNMPDFPIYLPWVVLGGAILLSVLLISDMPMFALKFKGFGFADNGLKYIFLLVSLILLIVFGLPGISLAVLLYILLSLIAMPLMRKKE